MKDYLGKFLLYTFIFDASLLTKETLLKLDMHNYLQDFVSFVFKYCDGHIDVSYFYYKLWFARFCVNCKDLYSVLACLAKVEADQVRQQEEEEKEEEAQGEGHSQEEGEEEYHYDDDEDEDDENQYYDEDIDYGNANSADNEDEDDYDNEEESKQGESQQNESQQDEEYAQPKDVTIQGRETIYTER